MTFRPERSLTLPRLDSTPHHQSPHLGPVRRINDSTPWKPPKGFRSKRYKKSQLNVINVCFFFPALCKCPAHTQLTLLSIKCKYCGSLVKRDSVDPLAIAICLAFFIAALLVLWLIRIAQLFHQYAFVVNRIFVACLPHAYLSDSLDFTVECVKAKKESRQGLWWTFCL